MDSDGSYAAFCRSSCMMVSPDIRIGCGLYFYNINEVGKGIASYHVRGPCTRCKWILRKLASWIWLLMDERRNKGFLVRVKSSVARKGLKRMKSRGEDKEQRKIATYLPLTMCLLSRLVGIHYGCTFIFLLHEDSYRDTASVLLFYARGLF